MFNTLPIKPCSNQGQILTKAYIHTARLGLQIAILLCPRWLVPVDHGSIWNMKKLHLEIMVWHRFPLKALTAIKSLDNTNLQISINNLKWTERTEIALIRCCNYIGSPMHFVTTLVIHLVIGDSLNLVINLETNSVINVSNPCLWWHN